MKNISNQKALRKVTQLHKQLGSKWIGISTKPQDRLQCKNNTTEGKLS